MDFTQKCNLYTVDQRGKTRIWSIQIFPENHYFETTYGLLDGKKIKRQTPVKVNNSGRDIREQLTLEVKQIYDEKIRKGYQLEVQSASKSLDFKVQLANKFEPNKIKYPVWVQPKYDGIRALARLENGEVKMYSRQKKVWPWFIKLKVHLKPILEKLDPGEALDGELFLDDLNFQDLASVVRQKKNPHPKDDLIIFYIFDLINTDLTLNQRWIRLQNIYESSDHIQLIHHTIVNNDNEIDKIHTQFVKDGHEGLVIRFPMEHGEVSYYKGGRNNNLLKYKYFQEEEAKIVDVIDNTRSPGMAVFVVEDDQGHSFKCTPAVNFEKKKKFLEDKYSYIGKQITFSYFGRSKDGIPRFPIGKDIRDYENA